MPMTADQLQRWQDEIDDEIARLSTGDEYDDDETRERLAALTDLSNRLDNARRLIGGNPGDGTLHDMLADAADHVDYEAEVVEQAADEIDDDEIAEAAHDQADAMVEAADSLDEAADAARDTAAAVFSETGIPQDIPKPDDDLDDVVAGNEITGESIDAGLREGSDGMTCIRCNVVVPWDELESHAVDVHGGDLRVTDLAFRDAIRGNPGELIPAPSEPPPDAPHLVPADAPPPAPTQEVADSAPESAHWYQRPIFGKGKG